MKEYKRVVNEYQILFEKIRTDILAIYKNYWMNNPAIFNLLLRWTKTSHERKKNNVKCNITVEEQKTMKHREVGDLKNFIYNGYQAIEIDG